MGDDIYLGVDPQTAREKMAELDHSVKMVEEYHAANWSASLDEWQAAFGRSEVTYDTRLGIAASYDKLDEVVRQGVITLCGLAEYYATFIKELDDFEIDMIERLHKIRSELDPDLQAPASTGAQATRAGLQAAPGQQQTV